jgi:hypothetical protein
MVTVPTGVADNVPENADSSDMVMDAVEMTVPTGVSSGSDTVAGLIDTDLGIGAGGGGGEPPAVTEIVCMYSTGPAPATAEAFALPIRKKWYPADVEAETVWIAGVCEATFTLPTTRLSINTLARGYVAPYGMPYIESAI